MGLFGAGGGFELIERRLKLRHGRSPSEDLIADDNGGNRADPHVFLGMAQRFAVTCSVRTVLQRKTSRFRVDSDLRSQPHQDLRITDIAVFLEKACRTRKE